MSEPLVGIIMGSSSDWETMRHAADTLDQLGVEYETKIVSAHRTTRRHYDYALSARERGHKVVIAGSETVTGIFCPDHFDPAAPPAGCTTDRLELVAP